MAEARRVEEAEGRGDGARNQRGADPSEIPKSDYLPLSQGPWASLQAAVKCTNSCQTDHTRERRRPQITVITAEPVDSDIWFPETSVVFPPSHPVWSADTVLQLPPSYDQVVEEKTWEEHGERPIAAPRRTTRVTQPDLVKGTTPSSIPVGNAAPKERPAGKTPQKPPRPLLPKSAVRKPSLKSVAPTDERLETYLDDDDRLDINGHHRSESPACVRSVTVHWNITKEPSSTVAPEKSSAYPEHSQAPVPRPRSKQRKRPTAKENEGQILVQRSEDCDTVRSDPGETASNKYLNELPEVLSQSNERENSNSADGIGEGEDAGGEMSYNHRNIRDRIQAFESQGGLAEASEPAKQEPEPREVTNKPPVAAKPSVALKPLLHHSVDDNSQNVSHANNPPAPAPKPQPPKKPVGLAIKGELETLHSKGSISNRSHPPKLTRSSCVYDEDPLPVPPVKPVKEPLKPNLNINNHNSTSVLQENQYVNGPSNNVPVNRSSFAKPSGTRRPTTIRVPSKSDAYNSQDTPPPLPAQNPVGELVLPPRRLNKTKSLPPRPPPAKTGPGRPPPPNIQSAGRSHSASWDIPAKQQSHKKGPVLPPRPNPGHRLYNKYTLQLPHGIAAINYGGSQREELSFQKNEVLLLIEEIDLDTYECQAGNDRGRVRKSHMKIITPLSSVADLSPPPQYTDCGLTVQAAYDFCPEGPGELSLRAGDVVTMVEQVDTEWYRGTCGGSTGFFPISYVKILSNSPRMLPARKAKPQAATISGPRCVARFDFEGEHSDELSFSEGDVIQLKAYVGQDWARGQMGTLIGIFPLNFVEVIEDLPPPSSQQVTQPNKVAEAAKPAEAGLEWVVALYDFAGNSGGDLSFQQGDHIQISRHIDSGWSCGRLHGREGIFPRAFVESAGHRPPAGRGRALYDFTSDSEEELSLQVGDIITNLESIDEEWFLGDLRGKRALVPKNYIQVLQ